MQFRDLKKQYEVLKEGMDAAIGQVLTESNYISGRQVAELEETLAAYVGVRHCIACANGTDALTLALMAWGIREGDAVFVPDFTFFSSAETAAYEGATPVFTDILEDTFNMDPDSLERAIKAVLAEGKLTPRAIVAVDLFGLPADYDRIRGIADRYCLYILEDAAQGFGGEYHGRRAGSFGDISTTSFFPAKPLGCYGDGGAVFTDCDEWAELIRSYRVHGKGSDKYDNVRQGAEGVCENSDNPGGAWFRLGAVQHPFEKPGRTGRGAGASERARRAVHDLLSAGHAPADGIPGVLPVWGDVSGDDGCVRQSAVAAAVAVSDQGGPAADHRSDP